MTPDPIRDALEEMVWQFAYRGVRYQEPDAHVRVLYTGGLSALELAFEALGWNDPYIPAQDQTEGCDSPECPEWAEAFTPDGKWCWEHGKQEWTEGA